MLHLVENVTENLNTINVLSAILTASCVINGRALSLSQHNE